MSNEEVLKLLSDMNENNKLILGLYKDVAANEKDIMKTFFQYAQEHDMPDVNTMSYYSRQFMPDESLFLKREVLNELIESGVMVSRNRKWIIKNLEK